MERCCWRTRGPFVAGSRARPGGEPARKHCVSAFGGRNRPRESARNMFLSSMLSPKEKMLKAQNTSKWGEVILNKSEKASGCVVARRVPGGRGTVPSRRPPLTNARLGHAAYLCFFGRQRGRRGCRGLEKPPTAPGRSCSSACDSLQLPEDSRLDTWSRFSKINKSIHYDFTYVAICAVRRSSSVTNHFHPVTCADHTWQTLDTVSHLSALKQSSWQCGATSSIPFSLTPTPSPSGHPVSRRGVRPPASHCSEPRSPAAWPSSLHPSPVRTHRD